MLAGAVSVYSQGQISLNDYNGNFAIQVFLPQSTAASTVAVSYGGYSGFEEMGQTANENAVPAGTASYVAGPLTGTSAAPAYSVQLLAAPGNGVAIGSLVPTGNVINDWYSGSASGAGLGGFWNVNQTDGIASVAGTTTTATVALAAWNNEGGTLTTLSAAQKAGASWGVSTTGNISALGFGTVLPPNLPTSITSFSLIAASTVPEPSTIALGVMGASAFLMRLRRK